MQRMVNEVSWKIGGEAGFGIMAAGATFAKTCVRAGLHAVDYSEYPSLIRGGHNTYQVAVAPRPLTAHRTEINILVALNKASIDQHLDELTPGAAVLYDSTDLTLKNFDPATISRRDLRWHSLPLETLTRAAGGEKLMRNTVALGATFALLSLEMKFPAAVLTEMFEHKGADVVEMNIKLLQAGYDAIPAEERSTFPWDLQPLPHPPARLFMTGNDALSVGAIQARCLFFAAYPMTPASTILSTLAKIGPDYGMVVRHAEDEIGVINETVGAGYAGVRAMCATAGGGFALMTEAVGMAGMAEVGIVIIEAQRGGPSTGLPTWTEQGDLRQVLHASQGDFLKIVLAPSNPAECYTMIQQAFNLADQYQTPVIVMTDKYLAEGHWTVEGLTPLPIRRGKIVQPVDVPGEQRFRRYETNVVDGISPRTIPGMPDGMFLANTDEHEPTGYTSEEINDRVAQMDKRARKEMTLVKEVPPPIMIGPAKADLTIVSWGSSLGPVIEAVHLLETEHHLRANILPITWVNPFPVQAVMKLLDAAHVTVMVEANQSGQMAGWIRQQTGRELTHHLRRYDGRPFDARELAKQLKQLVT